MKTLSAAAVLCLLPLLAAAQKVPPPIIDMHLHAFPFEAFPPGMDTLVGHVRPTSTAAIMEKTVAELRRFNIVAAVTSGFPDVLARYMEIEPRRIMAALAIPPGLPAPVMRLWADSLPKWYDQGRFRIIGEVATQYSGMVPSDPALQPFFAFAEQKGIPVGIHMGPGPAGVTYGFAPGYRIRHGNPLELEEVLVRHPKLKVYVMHAGYPFLNEMIALFAVYPQLHADVSWINWDLPREEFHRYLKGFVTAGFTNRLMFGSDQMLWPQTIDEAIQSIETAGFLTAKQKRDILYNNASRFLGLSEEEIARHRGK